MPRLSSTPLHIYVLCSMTGQTGHNVYCRGVGDHVFMWQLFTCESAAVHPSEMSFLPLLPRKRTCPAKDEHMVGVKDSLLAHSSDPVEMRRLNYQTQGMDVHTPISTPWFTHIQLWRCDHLKVRRCKDLLSLWFWEYSICMSVSTEVVLLISQLYSREIILWYFSRCKKLILSQLFLLHYILNLKWVQKILPLLNHNSTIQCHNTATPVGFPSKCSKFDPNLHKVSN